MLKVSLYVTFSLLELNSILFILLQPIYQLFFPPNKRRNPGAKPSNVCNSKSEQKKKKIRTIYKKYNKIKTRKYNMNTSIKMGCTHHWNEIKHLILKEIQLQRAIIFFEKQKKKSFYKYKGSLSVSCKKPHMSYFNKLSTGINALLYYSLDLFEFLSSVSCRYNL